MKKSNLKLKSNLMVESIDGVEVKKCKRADTLLSW